MNSDGEIIILIIWKMKTWEEIGRVIIMTIHLNFVFLNKYKWTVKILKNILDTLSKCNLLNNRILGKLTYCFYINYLPSSQNLQ